MTKDIYASANYVTPRIEEGGILKVEEKGNDEVSPSLTVSVSLNGNPPVSLSLKSLKDMKKFMDSFTDITGGINSEYIDDEIHAKFMDIYDEVRDMKKESAGPVTFIIKRKGMEDIEVKLNSESAQQVINSQFHACSGPCFEEVPEEEQNKLNALSDDLDEELDDQDG